MYSIYTRKKRIIQIIVLGIVFLLICLVNSVSAQTITCTITVTSAANSGAGTIREAIQESNSNPDVDTICFAVGSGDVTINLSSSLPALYQPVYIDGTTQPGFSGVPLIEINGTAAGSSYGVHIVAENITIKGLIINRFQKDGIMIQANNTTVKGSYIGTDRTGTLDRGNAWSGIGIISSNNIIGGTNSLDRNVVSGNDQTGIVICGSQTECSSPSGATNNTILGNYIGTNASGNGSIPNSHDGVLIAYSSSNTIGGTLSNTPTTECAGSCNLISGNTANGVGIWKVSSTNNTVLGNYIGTNKTGNAAVPNGDIGVESQDAPNNTIGGLTPEARNIISGNYGAGVSLTGSLTTANRVIGNYIGTNKTGNGIVKNHKMGVNIGSTDGGTSNANNNYIGGASGTTPGGDCSGDCNLISGNAWSGIYISGSSGGSNSIAGNYIGVGVNGILRIPNIQDGIGIVNSPNNGIGGPSQNARNIISGNGGNGVAVIGAASTGTRIENNYIGTATNKSNRPNDITGVALENGVDTAILANSIYSNGYMGIDLYPGGPTPNDGGDGDSGPNRLQNHPIITYSIPTSGGKMNIAGSLNSNANTTYRIDFFSSPECGRFGRGQAQNYYASTNIVTDASGNTSFNIVLPGTITGGMVVTGTATKLGGSTPFETSEISNCSPVPRSHPDGALISPLNSGNIFLLEDGKTRSIGSVEVLKSFNISTSEFKIATNGDTVLPGGYGLYFKEGTLIKGSAPDVFVIDKISENNYVKRKISNLSAFNSLGYTPQDVISVPDSALQIPNGTSISDSSQHPEGAVIKDLSTGNVYLIEAGKKRLIGSIYVYISHRINESMIKNATALDLSLANGTNLEFREGSILKGSSANIYIINTTVTGSEKRRVANMQAFNELGYRLNEIMTVPDSNLPTNNGAEL